MPTEAEWEFAARGGLDGAEFAWGDEFTPGGVHHGQHLAGRISRCRISIADGYERTSPVKAFPANGYGLHDMIGNVWEWTVGLVRAEARSRRAEGVLHSGKSARRPRGRQLRSRQPNIRIPRKVLKGGSHLCAPNYCRRYRPAARHAEPIDTSTSHVGFRCVKRTGAAE